MLDQLDQMQVSIPAPRLPASSAVSSYAIGPIDLVQITILQARLSTEQDIALLVPVHLPSSVFTHSEFKDGYERGYLSEDVTDQWSVPQIVNDVYANLCGVFTDEDDPTAYPWTVGELLGGFSRVAQTDQTLALVGIAHLCFLLPLFSQDRPADWPRREPYGACVLHDRAVKAYRACVRSYREQGQTFIQAQRSALLPCSFAFRTLPDVRPSQPADPLAALLAHPDFLEGLRCGRENFFDSYEEVPLAEAEMIDGVECCQKCGWELDSYLYNLGFVMGTINQGLTYQAGARQLGEEAVPCEIL